MGIVSGKCTSCGSAVEVENSWEVFQCGNCGTTVITEAAICYYNFKNKVVPVVPVAKPLVYSSVDFKVIAGELQEYMGVSQEVEIPGTVTSIGKGVFSGVTGITKVTIPDTVQTIGDGAFKGCTGLTNIEIPGSVRTIGIEAFSECTGLKEIHIPDSLEYVGDKAFSYCTGLTEITLPDINYGRDVFYCCRNIIKADISALSSEIPNGLFNGCGALKDIEMPDSVDSIGAEAFSSCSNLVEINIPNSVKDIGSSAFSYCRGLKKVDIPDSVQSIGSETFSSCYGLTKITIPDSVEQIGYSTFSGCTELKEIKLSKSLTYIGDSLFSGCEKLEELTIPNPVTQIGKDAFKNCSSLTTITIPPQAEIHSVGWNDYTEQYDTVFSGCKSLRYVYYRDSGIGKWYDSFKGSSWYETVYHRASPSSNCCLFCGASLPFFSSNCKKCGKTDCGR